MKFWLKLLILSLSCLLPTHSVLAEFSDPMRPPAYALEKFRLQKIKNLPPVIKKIAKPLKKNTWVLNSILYSSHRQHAIINNQLVKKGESIQGAKLVRLTVDSVRLLLKGKVIDLKIYDAKVRANIKSIRKSLNEKKIR